MWPICGVKGGLSICDVGLLAGSSAAKRSERVNGEMPVLHHGECGPFVALCVEYLQRLSCQVPKRLAPAERIAREWA